MDIQFNTVELGISMIIILSILYSVILGFRYFLRKRSKKLLSNEEPLLFCDGNKFSSINVFQYRPTMLGISFIIVLLANISIINWVVDSIEFEAATYEINEIEDIEVVPPPTREIEKKIPEVIESDEFLEKDIEAEDFVIEKTKNNHSEVEQVENVSKINETPAPLPLPEIEEDQPKDFFRVVEQMPRFPGCEDKSIKEERESCAERKLLEFIHGNIKYPAIARENGVEGMVVVQFVVDKDGTISNPKVVRDIGAGTGEEALRVVKMMNEMDQKWISGKQRGRPVRVLFNLPVKFELR